MRSLQLLLRSALFLFLACAFVVASVPLLLLVVVVVSVGQALSRAGLALLS
jgi:hypothetical protein